MNLSGFTSTISNFFSACKEKVEAFYDENKKLSLMIAGLILIILICLVLLLCLSPSSAKNKKNDKKPISQPLILTETVQIPESPELPDDYTISRKTETTWSDEESELWFTIPSEKEIKALSQTNNNMINELLGATP